MGYLAIDSLIYKYLYKLFLLISDLNSSWLENILCIISKR